MTYIDNQLYTGRNYQKVFVLFTAINDTANIEEALPIAKQVRAAGAHVIVIALGNTTNNTLSQLGDQHFTSAFSISDHLSRQIVQSTCHNGGSTYTTLPITSTTPSSSNNLSNAYGSPCAANATNAWLDVVLVIEVSNVLTTMNLRSLGAMLAVIFSSFTVGQSPTHSTRVAIVTYAYDAEYHYNLTDNTNLTDLANKLLELPQYRPGNSGVNLQEGFRAAANILSNQRSYRRQVIIAAVATYDPSGFNDASQIAEDLKENGITIFSILLRLDDSDFINRIRNLTSPGYSYRYDDPDVIDKVVYGLSQANCFCPPTTLQFKIYDQDSDTMKVYADCISGYSGNVDPQIAPLFCSPGILASVTSNIKFDFILHNIVPHDLSGAKNLTVGAFRENGIWYWYDYNNTKYALGNFPQIVDNGGNYGYFTNFYGFNWMFSTGEAGAQNARPIVCQSRACDTDYFCDLKNS